MYSLRFDLDLSLSACIITETNPWLASWLAPFSKLIPLAFAQQQYSSPPPSHAAHVAMDQPPLHACVDHRFDMPAVGCLLPPCATCMADAFLLLLFKFGAPEQATCLNCEDMQHEHRSHEGAVCVCVRVLHSLMHCTCLIEGFGDAPAPNYLSPPINGSSLSLHASIMVRFQRPPPPFHA